MSATRHGRLLLVEDEARLRNLIAIFLKLEGYEIIEAEDGLQGVERYFDSGPFDLVIVDLDLPKLPGVEVCRRIKAFSPSQAILVCSAAILEPHFAALETLQIDHILTKPYLPGRLLGEIQWAVAGASSSGAVSSSNPPVSNTPQWHSASADSTGHIPQYLVKITNSK